MPATKPGPPSTPSSLDPLILRLQMAMFKGLFPPVLEAEPSQNCPAAANPAVARCVQAYNQAYDAVICKKDKESRDARYAGQFAYRQSLPPLVGRRNIRDFTACVAHGMLLKVIDPAEGARILYAAQVASTNRASRSQKTQKNALKPPKNVVKAPESIAQEAQNQ